jgi:excisionase family DNA binding protein
MPRKQLAAINSSAQTAVEVRPLLVNLPTAAKILGTTLWTVRGLLWSRKIPHVKIGRRFLVAPEDLQAYVLRLKGGEL